MTEKVAIYGRVSTSDQTTDNQIYKLKEIIEINGWDQVDVYVDEGISGQRVGIRDQNLIECVRT